MAEAVALLGVIASVVQIVDVCLQFSRKLCTFGEIVASADKTILSISKDVSHTCMVLHDLEQTLDQDQESHLFNKRAMGVEVSPL